MSSKIKDNLFEVLDRLSPKCLKYAHSLVGNETDANDLVMDTFTAFLERFNVTQELPDNIEAYLITSIKNRSRNIKRKTNRETPSILSSDYIQDQQGMVNPNNPNPTLPSDPNMKIQIERALAELGENCREILQLVAFGWAYAEIQQHLGRPLNTIAQNIFRCRQSFRELMYGTSTEEKIDQ